MARNPNCSNEMNPIHHYLVITQLHTAAGRGFSREPNPHNGTNVLSVAMLAAKLLQSIEPSSLPKIGQQSTIAESGVKHLGTKWTTQYFLTMDNLIPALRLLGPKRSLPSADRGSNCLRRLRRTWSLAWAARFVGR